MPVITSKCVVCGSKFEGILISSPYRLYQKYNAFCKNLLNEDCQILWNSYEEPFPFCDGCKFSVEHLFAFHEQHEMVHGEINKIVSSISSTILQNVFNQDDDFYSDTHLNKNGSTHIDKNVLNKINTLRRAICKSFDPQVILLDCRSQRKFKKRKLDSSFIETEANSTNAFVQHTKEAENEDCSLETDEEEIDPLKIEPLSPIPDDDHDYCDQTENTNDQTENSNEVERPLINLRKRTRKVYSDYITNDDDNCNNKKSAPEQSMYHVSTEEWEEKYEALRLKREMRKSKARKYKPREEEEVPEMTMTLRVRPEKNKKKKKNVPKPKVVKKVVVEEKKIEEPPPENDEEEEIEDEEFSEEEDEDWIVAQTMKETKMLKNSKNPNAHVGETLFPIIEDDEDGTLQYGTWKFVKEEDGIYNCLDCGLTLKRSSVARHVNSSHILNVEDQPDRPNKITVDDEGKYHYLSWTFEKVDEKFKCNVCENLTKSQYTMTVHIDSFHNAESLSCKDCGRTWKTEEGLKNHKCEPPKSHTLDYTTLKCIHLGEGKYMYDGKWPYEAAAADPNDPTKVDIRLGLGIGWKCGLCDVYKGKMSNLIIHIQQRHAMSAGKSYVCEICGYSANYKKGLITHQAVHSDERSYVCEVCGKAFKTPSALSTHIKTHTSRKKYGCDQCDRRFNNASNLKRHRRNAKHFESNNSTTPLQSNAFECHRCKKNYQGQAGLNIHLARRKCKEAESKSLSCPHCSYVETDRQYLMRHLELVHNVTNFHYKKIRPLNIDPMTKDQSQPNPVQDMDSTTTITTTEASLSFTDLINVTENVEEVIPNDNEGEFSLSNPTTDYYPY